MSVAAPLTRVDSDADLERRFGGLRRLFGDVAYLRVRAARIAVIGVGGVGSWTAEALARSGVAALTLIDLDHVAESNVNRQVQARVIWSNDADMRSRNSPTRPIGPDCCPRRWMRSLMPATRGAPRQ